MLYFQKFSLLQFIKNRCRDGLTLENRFVDSHNLRMPVNVSPTQFPFRERCSLNSGGRKSPSDAFEVFLSFAVNLQAYFT
jgi:hypothetical protein